MTIALLETAISAKQLHIAQLETMSANRASGVPKMTRLFDQIRVGQVNRSWSNSAYGVAISADVDKTVDAGRKMPKWSFVLEDSAMQNAVCPGATCHPVAG